jgi:UDP-2,4-diacetamido-2,4,6-trideoxy-beta-L-altropyranose hydrolase
LKNIYFRVFASGDLGGGHLSRCLSLAVCLQESVKDVVFVTDQESVDNFPKLTTNFRVILLPREIDERLDATNFVSNVANLGESAVVVDHYGFGAVWESIVGEAAILVAALDDMGRPHAADLVIDQNLRSDANELYRDRPPTSKLLSGPSYALLGAQYRREQGLSVYLDRPKKVLVSYGNGNQRAVLAATVDSLERQPLSNNWQASVVLGAALQSDKDLRVQATRAGLTTHGSLPSLAPLLSSSQIAIGAGGSSAWERLFFGVPALVVCLVDNQREICRNLADAGLIFYLGEHEQYDFAQLPKDLLRVIGQESLREQMSQKGRDTVDGFGVKRVGAHILAKSLSVRAAIRSDVQKIYDWRFHDDVCGFAKIDESTSYEEHAEEVARKLNSQGFLLVSGALAGRDGSDIGVVSFYSSGDSIQLSVFLRSEFIGTVTGAALLLAAEDFYLKAQGYNHKPSHFVSEIPGSDAHAQSLFSYAGYASKTGANDGQAVHRKVSDRKQTWVKETAI